MTDEPDEKAPPELVATRARSLASELLATYPVALAPQSAPDLQRGAALFAQQRLAPRLRRGRREKAGLNYS